MIRGAALSGLLRELASSKKHKTLVFNNDGSLTLDNASNPEHVWMAEYPLTVYRLTTSQRMRLAKTRLQADLPTFP